MAHEEPRRRQSWTWRRGAATLRVLMALAMLLPLWTTLLGGAAAQQDIPTADCQQALARNPAINILRLTHDCVTTVPINVADGWTFEGGGHTIYAQDPSGGQLTGGVLRVTQGTATVQSVVIDGRSLTQPCRDDPGAMIAAVAFAGAGGVAQWVTVQRFARSLPPGGEPILPLDREACGAGVHIGGAAASVTVTNSDFADLAYAGIVVDGSIATISHNEIRRVAGAGVLAQAGARVRLTPKNLMREVGLGVLFQGAGTTGRIAGNSLAHMETSGIVIRNGAYASIAGNEIEDAGDLGIDAVSGASATLTQNTITGADFGVGALEATLDIRETTVTNSRAGIISFAGAQIIVRESAVRDCEFGMGAQEGQIVIHDSSVVTCSSTGLQAEFGGTLEAHGVRVTQARYGVRALGGSTVSATDSDIIRSTESGIVASQGSTLRLAGSHVTSPGELGVYVADPGTTAVVTGSAVSGATVHSLEVLGGAHLTASDLRVYGGEIGIQVVEPNTMAEISDSFISGAGTSVSVTGGAEATLTRLFSTASTVGVAVSGAGSRATIRESTIQRASMDGVQVTGGGWGSVEQSEVLGAVVTGVLPLGGTEPAPPLLLEMDANGCVQTELEAPAGQTFTLVVQNHDTEFRQMAIPELRVDLVAPPAAQSSVELGPATGSVQVQCDWVGAEPGARTAVLRFVPAAELPAASTAPQATPVAAP